MIRYNLPIIGATLTDDALWQNKSGIDVLDILNDATIDFSGDLATMQLLLCLQRLYPIYLNSRLSRLEIANFTVNTAGLTGGANGKLLIGDVDCCYSWRMVLIIIFG